MLMRCVCSCRELETGLRHPRMGVNETLWNTEMLYVMILRVMKHLTEDIGKAARGLLTLTSILDYRRASIMDYKSVI